MKAKYSKILDSLNIIKQLNYSISLLVILSLFLNGCAGLADGVAAISGKGGTIARNDAFDETKRRADSIAKDYPKTEWESIYPQEAADFIENIDNSRVLIGTVEVGSYLGVPDHKEIILYNSKTGKAIWKAERESLPRGAFTVLVTKPLIILAGVDEKTTYFLALDPKTGAKRWDYIVKASSSYSLSDKRDKIMLLTSTDSEHKLEAIEIKTGKILWNNNNLPGDLFDNKSKASIFLGKRAAYIAGRKLTKLSSKNGKLLWTANHTLLKNRTRSAMYIKKGILLWDKNNLVLLSYKNGKTLWDRPATKTDTKFIAYLNNMVFRVTGKDLSRSGSIDYIQAINVINGKTLWYRKAGGTVVSPLALNKGILIYTTDGTVTGLSAKNGKQKFKRKLPSSFRKNSPTKSGALAQPDILHFRTGKLHLAREYAGIATYTLPFGKPLWNQKIYPMLNDIYGASARYFLMLSNMKMHGHTVTTETQNGDAFSFYEAYPHPTLQAAQSGIMTSMRQQSDAQTRRNRASQSYIYSNEIGGQSMMDFSGARGVLNASVDLAVAVEQALKEAAIHGLLSRELMQIQAAFQMYKKSFQGKYYLRPFSNEHGRGVTLVNLNTGKRHDLVFSPPIKTLLLYSVDLQSFAIDPGNNRLLTIGVGLNSKKYQEYVKWKWRMPKPSLLAYRLRNLKFTKDNVNANRIRRQRLLGATGPTALLGYSATGDIVSVRGLLATGHDINTRELTQNLTPLMMASLNGHESVVKYLLTKGAKINLVSKRGMTALDFSRDKNIRKNAGLDTPAHARKFKRIEKLLLKSGAKAGTKQPSAKDIAQANKLVANALYGKVNVVKKLLDNGVDIDSRFILGGNTTALISATTTQRVELVRMLLKRGANTKLKSDDGKTALDIAHETKNKEIIEMLSAAK